MGVERVRRRWRKIVVMAVSPGLMMMMMMKCRWAMVVGVSWLCVL
jgi:hypothetical protein